MASRDGAPCQLRWAVDVLRELVMILGELVMILDELVMDLGELVIVRGQLVRLWSSESWLYSSARAKKRSFSCGLSITSPK